MEVSDGLVSPRYPRVFWIPDKAALQGYGRGSRGLQALWWAGQVLQAQSLRPWMFSFYLPRTSLLHRFKASAW